MLKSPGQWVASINGIEINAEELISLSVYESAGLSLPTLQLRFRTNDKAKVRRYETPGYIIEIGMGKDDIQWTSNFIVFKKEIKGGLGSNEWIVDVKCFIDAIDYLTKQKCRVFETTGNLKASSEVFETVVGGFGFSPETTMSDDKMLWLQVNNTDRQFLEETLWHGFWAVDDPCLSALKRDMKAVYKPLSELMTVEGVIGDQPSDDIKLNDFSNNQNEGLLSAWSGDNRRTPYHRSEDGFDEDNDGNVSPKISSHSGLTPDLDRVGEIDHINDNVHENWQVAYRQNRQFRSALAATSLTGWIENYNNVHLLQAWDVMLHHQGQDGHPPMTPFNGTWLITSVSTTIQQHTMHQYIKLNRETLLEA